MTDPAIEAAQRAMRLTTTRDTPIRHAEAAAREALAPLRKIHRQNGDSCWTCDYQEWPCDSAKLIYPEGEL